METTTPVTPESTSVKAPFFSTSVYNAVVKVSLFTVGAAFGIGAKILYNKVTAS